MNVSRSRRLLLGLVVLIVLFAPRVAQVFADALWFDSLSYASVFWYSFSIKFGLFAGFFVATLVILRGAFFLIERAYGDFVFGETVIPFENQPLELRPETFLKPLAWGVALIWSLLIGFAMAARWELFALYFNGSAAGNPDPIFNKPLGFFLFTWPVHSMISSWLTGLAFIILAGALLYGFFVFMSKMPDILKREGLQTATTSCSIALGALLVVYAWRFYLGRFSQLWRDHEVFTGAGYTEAHITLPGQMLVAYVLLGAAALCIANALKWKKPRLLIVAPVIPMVFSIGLGLVGNYVGNFVVKPNELERQTPYIKNNIEATRRAFGLNRITTRDFPTSSGVEAFNLKENSSALDNIRLWDWKALQATLRQVQVLRTYYDFPDVDVDRYQINGRMRQIMIAARELDIERLPSASRNWVNEKLVYTHGYGVTMNTADGFTPEGRPRFLLSDVPVLSNVPEVKLTRPEIYFGQLTNSHVYVKTKQKEFDHPQGETNAYTTYEGTGGMLLGGFARRMLLSWALGDLSKIPFSNDITPESRVLLHRNIVERAQLIAPFLTYDHDPYIVVGDDGRLYWIMDAYTSSLYYPYSRHHRAGNEWANYLRNSVKVVIDAYDGSTKFYVFDDEDPMIKAYRGAFPKLFTDASQMPAGLRKHVRYPELMFRTQAEVYELYHMQDVRLFFGREDVWSVAGTGDAAPINPMFGANPLQPQQPQGPVEAETMPIDPYFVLMPLPGEKKSEEFIMILPFTPSKRRNMIGWMAARSDSENYGSLLTYNFPKSQLVDGPAQIKARIDQDSFLAGQFTLWNQQGSTVLRGNMLVIPLGKSLLYVEPIFLQANQSPMPELRLVVLGTQDRIVYATTFREALTKLLGSGANLPDSGQETKTPPKPPTDGGEKPAPPTGVAPTRQQLINRAADDLEAYQKLTAAGRYSQAGARLESVRKTLEQLRREGQ